VSTAEHTASLMHFLFELSHTCAVTSGACHGTCIREHFAAAVEMAWLWRLLVSTAVCMRCGHSILSKVLFTAAQARVHLAAAA
jgi:hypothetical protein